MAARLQNGPVRPTSLVEHLHHRHMAAAGSPGQSGVALAFHFRFLRNLTARSTVGSCLLALWCGWMLAAFAAIAPAPPVIAELPEAAQAQLHARLPDAAIGRPVAIRLAGSCTCPGDDASWDTLVHAMDGIDGTALRLAQPLPALPGQGVAVLGADGRVRYAGPLQPDPALCGAGPASTRLARWLPALLADGQTPYVVQAAACAC